MNLPVLIPLLLGFFVQIGKTENLTVFNPVNGKDGQTYNNECQMNCALEKKERKTRQIDNDGEKITKILDNFLQNYDKRVRPNFGGEPVEVGITLYTLSIDSISEINMDFSLSFYFRQKWSDPRLKFRGPSGIGNISVGAEFRDKIWVPDTFFVNEKRSAEPKIGNEFIRISENGDVLRSVLYTSTFTCPMDLKFYPMDAQLCPIEIESFGFTMRDIKYKWAKGLDSVEISNEISLPSFKVMGHRQGLLEIDLTSGSYSRVHCEIQFVRSLGYHLLTLYYPIGLLVILSWTSFWIDRKATTDRTFVGVSTTILIGVMMGVTNANLPHISYLKASDIYFIISLILAFMAFLEYCTVAYFGRQIERQTILGKESKIFLIKPATFDKVSRIIFPVCFIIFNIIYWICYTNASVVEDDLILI